MTPDGRYARRAKISLECFACSKEFTATRHDARYCSAMCRQQMSRACRAIKALHKLLSSTNAPEAAARLAGAGPGASAAPGRR